jgi:predicted nucleic acid-binding protein
VRSVLADTGPLYALVDPEDRFHGRARDEALRIAEQGWSLLVAFPTLLESHSLVLRRLGPIVSRRWLDEVTTGLGLLNPDRDDYLAATRRLRSFADQRISLFDALVAEIADQLRIRVWTFDHHFDVMGAAVWR